MTAKIAAPLYSLEAEQAMLSSLMADVRRLRKVDLVEDDFYRIEHKIVFQTMAEMAEDGELVDLPLLTSRLKKNNKLEEAGGLKSISSMFDASDYAFLTHNYKEYAKTIRQFSIKRQLLSLSRQIQKYASNGTPDIGDEIEKISQDITKLRQRAQGDVKSLADKVREWVLLTDGNFLLTDVYRDLDLLTRNNKMAAIMAIQRLEQEGMVTKCGEKRGCYRPINSEAPEIDFINADTETTFPLEWPYPFSLEKLVTIYPRNVIVVAGAANAGKTAMLLNLVDLSLRYDYCNAPARITSNKHYDSLDLQSKPKSKTSAFKPPRIRYLSSEMGAEELQLRLSKFEAPMSHWQDRRLKFLERSSNFADVIDPDALNLIDYLEMHKDFYQIGDEIKKIFDRLRKGIAVIALQKKRGQDVGRGGEFTLEKPRLYLAMDPGKLTVVKAKNWANPLVNPNNKVINFKLVQGCKFVSVVQK